MLWVGVPYVSLNSSGARLYKNLQTWFDMYRTGYRTVPGISDVMGEILINLHKCKKN